MTDVTTKLIHDTFIQNRPDNVGREEAEELFNHWLELHGFQPEEQPAAPTGFEYETIPVEDGFHTVSRRLGRHRTRIRQRSQLRRHALRRIGIHAGWQQGGVGPRVERLRLCRRTPAKTARRIRLQAFDRTGGTVKFEYMSYYPLLKL